jgi:hypothetical protein
VADEHRPLDPVPPEDLEQIDEVVAMGLPYSVAKLPLGEPLGLAVPPGVPSEDLVVVLPATDRVRPAAARIGETVEEQERRSARLSAAEPVEAEVLTGVRGWHT